MWKLRSANNKAQNRTQQLHKLKKEKGKEKKKKRKKAVFKVTKLNMISYGLGFQGGILRYFIKD